MYDDDDRRRESTAREVTTDTDASPIASTVFPDGSTVGGGSRGPAHVPLVVDAATAWTGTREWDHVTLGAGLPLGDIRFTLDVDEARRLRDRLDAALATVESDTVETDERADR